MEDRFLIDHLKATVFADYRAAIQSVREGEDPGRAFRRHEARVARLRGAIARLEQAAPAGPVPLRLVQDCGRDWKPPVPAPAPARALRGRDAG